MPKGPIAIFYEHPQWFQPLFDELDRRSVDYEKVHLRSHRFDPCEDASYYSLIVNRVSAYPSATIEPRIVLYVKQYLAYLEWLGLRVINGRRSYEVGTSKALQMQIFNTLALKTPHSRVIHHPDQAVEAADELRYPILIKPNVGGSGAGITLLRERRELIQSVKDGKIDLGIDSVALVQEYLSPQDASIYRVEMMDGAFLYGLRLPIVGENFNYCPADGCNIQRFDHCPLSQSSGKSKTFEGSGISSFEPPPEVIEKAGQALSLAGADLGGVEYLINAADGQFYFYDINPLSNFVANAVQVVGFEPVQRFVDYILKQAAH